MLIKKNINVSKRTSNFDKQSQTYKYTLNQMKFLMSDSFEEYAHLKTYIKLWQTISNVLYTLNPMKFLISNLFEEYTRLKMHIKLWQTTSNE